MNPTEDGQEIFEPAVVNQAVRNIADLVGMGIDDPEVNMKLVIEASNQVLNRKYGKPVETVKVSHKIGLRIDIPDWNMIQPAPAPLIIDNIAE